MRRTEPLAAQRSLLGIAGVGGVVFLALFALGAQLGNGDEPVSHALLLAVLVLVPAGLSLVEAVEGEGPFFLLLAYLTPPAMIGGTLSIFFDAGPVAGGAASLWVVPSVLCATLGMGRIWNGARTIGRLALPLAWICLPLGAVWLVLARFGASPFGLSSLFVALTAVHFHFAAFTSLTLFSLVWVRLEEGWGRSALAVAIALKTVAIVVLLASFILAPENLGSARSGIGAVLSGLVGIMMTVAYALHAAVVLRWLGPRLTSPVGRIFILGGCLAPLVSLPLAVAYTLGQMDLNTMVLVHGQLSAYGFAAASLFGWVLESRFAPTEKQAPAERVAAS